MIELRGLVHAGVYATDLFFSQTTYKTPAGQDCYNVAIKKWTFPGAPSDTTAPLTFTPHP